MKNEKIKKEKKEGKDEGALEWLVRFSALQDVVLHDVATSVLLNATFTEKNDECEKTCSVFQTWRPHKREGSDTCFNPGLLGIPQVFAIFCIHLAITDTSHVLCVMLIRQNRSYSATGDAAV